MLELTLELAAELLHLGGLATDMALGRQLALQALNSGAAAERFARMVAQLGGPADVLHQAQLPAAPVVVPVAAPHSGMLAAMDVRALGLAVVALGGGRSRPSQAVDPRVGLAAVLPLGSNVQRGQPLALVHAASQAAAEQALQQVLAALQVLEPGSPASGDARAAGWPVVLCRAAD